MVEITRQNLGLPVESPNIFRQPEIAAGYKPSTGEVVGAFVGGAFEGAGTLSSVTRSLEVDSLEDSQKPITQQEYEQSEFFRSGVEWHKDMTLGSAKIQAENADDDEYRGFIIGQSNTPQKIVGGVSAFGAGIFEPLNLGVGLATNLGFSTLGKSVIGAAKLASMTSKYSNLTLAMARAAAEGFVSVIPQELAARYTADTLQEDYGIDDTLMNFAVSTGASGVIQYGVSKIGQYSNKRIRTKNEPTITTIKSIAEANGLDPNVALAITGYESGFKSQVNPASGAFGPFQFMPDTAKQFGITPESSLEDQTKAFVKFTKQNTSYLEKSLNRELTPTDVYMAHWMGAKGAEVTLKADPEAFALQVFKDNGLYKGYEEKVLSQNRLSPRAKIKDIVEVTRARVESGLRKAVDEDSIPSVFRYKGYQERLLALDTATNKMTSSKELDMHAHDVITERPRETAVDFYNTIPPERLSEYSDIVGFRDLQVARNNYTAAISERDIATTKLQNFDINKATEIELRQSGYPLDVITGYEQQLDTLIADRAKLRETIDAGKTGKRHRKFDEETTKLVEEAKANIKNIKTSNRPDAIKEARQKVQKQKTSLKAELKKLENNIVARQTEMEQAYNTFKPALDATNQRIAQEALVKDVDPLNDTAIDKDLINQRTAYYEELERMTPQKAQQALEKLESEVEMLREAGSLNKEVEDAIAGIKDMPEEELQKFFANAYSCLKRGV
jgi:hypothetical protein